MKWTPPEERTLKALWASDLKVIAICLRLGRSYSAVYKKAASMNLPKKEKSGGWVEEMHSNVNEFLEG